MAVAAHGDGARGAADEDDVALLSNLSTQWWYGGTKNIPTYSIHEKGHWLKRKAGVICRPSPPPSRLLLLLQLLPPGSYHCFHIHACPSAAGAGASVCKHGNRKASSTSGSFDLLDALGIDFDLDASELEHQVERNGVGFAFARAFHPAMRHVGPVRAELGIPTVFNILGPLSHPGRLRRQVIGASDWGLAHRMAETLRNSGSVRSLIVHGAGGLDELTTTGPSRLVRLDDGVITELEIDARDYGLARVAPDELAGGDAAENARIAERIFSGERFPARDIVVLNAAAGLVAAGAVDDLGNGVEAAAAAIDAGAAAAKLAASRDGVKGSEG